MGFGKSEILVEDIYMTKKPLLEDGRKIAAYSAGLNLCLASIKGGLAFLSGSKALLAETIHSFTDVIGSLAVWIGIVISRKRSPSFPWGLYKVENIAAVVSAFFILLAAYEVAKSTFISKDVEITHINVSLVILFLMVIPIVLFALYEKKEAVRLNSPSLLADARNRLTDIAPLVIVIAGLAGTRVYPHADKIAAVIIIIFILKASYEIVKDSMKSLLDASVDSLTIKKIREVVGNFKEVEEITALHARNSGSFIFIHLNLRLSVKRLKEAHKISGIVEETIKEEIPFVERVVIHYEPEKKDFVRYAVPLANKEGEISEHFSSAPFIALWDKKILKDVLLNQEVFGNPFLDLEKGKGIRLAEFLVEKGVDILVLKKYFEHKGPEYVLSNAEIEIQKRDVNFLKELVDFGKESRR
ncbi:MAG: cation diffusion facilitator family transporter [Nitrospirae bacterium]|nr:cation diffusion facilitator family transporter [Nitrospirota bacterium]